MEIIIGKNAGFCYGVENAVNGAIKELELNNSKYCLGEIVHNKEVVKELENKGLVVIDNISKDIKEKNNMENIIIRAHGISKEVYELCDSENIKIYDYTCPNVLNIHKIANKHANLGYYIILCGTKKHPENIGTISFCGEYKSILENKEEIDEVIEKIVKSKKNKILLISQTTFSNNKFIEIENILKNKINIDKNLELIVKNTICMATKIRQDETDEISRNVQYMIIIGGKNSSNTKKLYEIAKFNCESSVCIETYKELNLNEIKKYKKIGIMAGASTPKKSIEDVASVIKSVN